MSIGRFVVSAATLGIVCAASGLWSVSALTVQRNGERVHESREEGVALPQVLSESKPQYTAEAMRAGIEGTMAVAAVVNTDGTVGEVRVTRSLDQEYGLDEEGVKAARQWRFRPGTKDGNPVAVRVDIEFTFTLRDRPR